MAAGRVAPGVQSEPPTTNPLADSTERDVVLPPLPAGFEAAGFEAALRNQLGALEVLYPGRGHVTARIDTTPGRPAAFHFKLGGDGVLVGQLAKLPPAPELPPGVGQAVRSHLAAVRLLYGGRGHVEVRISREPDEKPVSVTHGGTVTECRR